MLTNNRGRGYPAYAVRSYSRQSVRRGGIGGGSSSAGNPNLLIDTDFSGGAANPIVTAGGFSWKNGGTDYTNWQNCKIVAVSGGSGFALVGTGQAGSTSQGNEFDDPICDPVITHNDAQWAEITVYKLAAYNPLTEHEVEVGLRRTASSGSVTQYEVLWGIAGNSNIVKWLGAEGGFIAALSTDIALTAPVDGDILYAEITAAHDVNVYINHTFQYTFNVNTGSWSGLGTRALLASGRPGFGCWPRFRTSLLADPAAMGARRYRSGNL